MHRGIRHVENNNDANNDRKDPEDDVEGFIGQKGFAGGKRYPLKNLQLYARQAVIRGTTYVGKESTEDGRDRILAKGSCQNCPPFSSHSTLTIT